MRLPVLVETGCDAESRKQAWCFIRKTEMQLLGPISCTSCSRSDSLLQPSSLVEGGLGLGGGHHWGCTMAAAWSSVLGWHQVVKWPLFKMAATWGKIKMATGNLGGKETWKTHLYWRGQELDWDGLSSHSEQPVRALKWHRRSNPFLRTLEEKNVD